MTLAVANAAASMIHAAGYVRAADVGSGVVGWSYLMLALVAELWALSLAPALLGGALAGSVQGRLVGRALLPPLYTLLHGFLFVDRTVFAITHSHMNKVAFEMLSTSGGIDALGLSRGEMLRLAAAGLAVLIAEVALHAWALRRARALKARGGRITFRRAIVVAVMLLSSERVAYASALYARAPGVARAASTLPSYEIERAVRLRAMVMPRARYPRGPLAFHAVERPPNVVWIVIESWRRDALDPLDTPRLWSFAQKAEVFRNHVSGGNWTYAGVFSMFYGLHAPYAEYMAESRRGPALFHRLRDLRYDVRAIASRNTSFPRFRDTVFADVEHVDDDLPGETSAEKDEALAARAGAFLDARNPSQPFFLALFVDSTHLPYSFPRGFDRHRPYSDHLYYTEMTAPMERQPIYNRYRNALSWVDDVTGRVLDDLAARGLLESTAVVIVGDHGQEFYEHGALGHNIAFTPEQVDVPLVLRIPGRPPGERHDLTRHVDIAATLLDLLGLDDPPSAASLGRSLLRAGAAEHAVSCGTTHCAVIEPDGAVTVFDPRLPSAPVRSLDAEYRPAPLRPSSHLQQARDELRAFLD